jgi:hypothetical protein
MTPFTPRTRLAFFLALCCCAPSVGCGSDDGLGKLYPVSGKVLLDGKPLTNVG